MILLIEIKENSTMNIRQFTSISGARQFMWRFNEYRNMSELVVEKHMRLYKSHPNGATVIILDTSCVNIDTLVPNGLLHTAVSIDENHPGLDIEYIPDDPNEYPCEMTLPRIVIEKPVETNELVAMLWADVRNEDYSHKIRF